MQRPHISEVIHNPGGYSLATVWIVGSDVSRHRAGAPTRRGV